MTPITELLDRAPDLHGEVADAAPRLAIVPKRSLRDHVTGIDLIIETIERLEDDGELTEEARYELSAALVVELAGTRRKVDNVSGALSTWATLDAGAAKEIERLQKRRTRFARLIENLELHVLAVLEASGLPKIEGEISTLQVKLNPPSVVIDDESRLTEEFFRYPPAPPPSPDKSAIARALKANREVPGCRLIQKKRLVRE